MRNKIFNTNFENMLRMLLLLNVLDVPANVDRIAALDFICIYGKKCGVLNKNLHGDNDFGFSEFANKRQRIAEAIRLAVRNDFIDVIENSNGFCYQINDRGRVVVEGAKSPYSDAYSVGAKIVSRSFVDYSDGKILQFISDKAIGVKEG